MSDADLLAALLDAAWRGGLIALLAVLAGRLWRARRGSALATTGGWLAAGLVVQLVSSAPSFEARVPLLSQVPCIAVATANSVLFWAFAQALFDDDARLGPRHLLAWLAVVLLAALNCSWLARPGASAAEQVAHVVLRLMPLGFALAALQATLAHWRGDLVEPRRRLRLLVVAGGVLYTAAQLALRLAGDDGRLSTAAALVDLAGLALLIGLMLRGGAGLAAALPVVAEAPAAAPVDAPLAAEPSPQTDAADLQLAERLQQLMRDEGLTIAALAARLAVPEYRLRRAIHGQLGHRHFTAFVNSWRLRAASQALADPACREQSVLHIAMAAGFQSIGPFNRAFKAAQGLTPSEFRRQRLAET
ncbi:AraC family transcriptional regulator [Ideonella azotifigens]|uniref:Helix-turn-helix domain-containing protein n=1 Tax=Ideonella azotifigens TaxID=513160 RepID=A0ABN1JRD5_9BURK|nr:AraC family transcriptional regulator [Ideonella azotifigens]MCD2340284.1 AraC family transcriptional regulator [Ideonella azotifigens]